MTTSEPKRWAEMVKLPRLLAVGNAFVWQFNAMIHCIADNVDHRVFKSVNENLIDFEHAPIDFNVSCLPCAAAKSESSFEALKQRRNRLHTHPQAVIVQG